MDENKHNLEENGEASGNSEVSEIGENSDISEISEAPPSTYKKTGWLMRDVYDWAESVLTAVIAIVFIFAFIVRTTYVDGESMYPTLNDGDRLLVSNFLYQPKHNDIVVIYADRIYDSEKDQYGKPLIKRVIGLPGDEIVFNESAGTVTRNGEVLKIETEDGLLYEDGHLINSITVNSEDFISGAVIVVPENCYLVLGDNRGNSVDSRFNGEDNLRRGQYVGFVDENYIVGRAFLRISPFNAFGFV